MPAVTLFSTSPVVLAHQARSRLFFSQRARQIILTYWTQFCTRSHTNISRGHSWKLHKEHSQSDIRLYFLFSAMH